MPALYANKFDIAINDYVTRIDFVDERVAGVPGDIVYSIVLSNDNALALADLIKSLSAQHLAKKEGSSV